MSAKKKHGKRAKVKTGKVLKLHTSSMFGKVDADMNGATVTFKDAMKQTGRSMGHIYRCINDGRLPAFKVGRETVFRQSDIDKLLTPVPYKPVSARGYAKPKAKAATKPRARTRPARKTRKVHSRTKAKGNSKPAALKATVAKALKAMGAEGVEGTS